MVLVSLIGIENFSSSSYELIWAITSLRLKWDKLEEIPAHNDEYVGPRPQSIAYTETISWTWCPAAANSSQVLWIFCTNSVTDRVPFEFLRSRLCRCIIHEGFVEEQWDERAVHASFAVFFPITQGETDSESEETIKERTYWSWRHHAWYSGLMAIPPWSKIWVDIGGSCVSICSRSWKLSNGKIYVFQRRKLSLVSLVGTWRPTEFGAIGVCIMIALPFSVFVISDGKSAIDELLLCRQWLLYHEEILRCKEEREERRKDSYTRSSRSWNQRVIFWKRLTSCI